MSLSETFRAFAATKAAWGIHHGDSITEMARMPSESIDFSVFSPPFFRRYTPTLHCRKISATVTILLARRRFT